VYQAAQPAVRVSCATNNRNQTGGFPVPMRSFQAPEKARPLLLKLYIYSLSAPIKQFNTTASVAPLRRVYLMRSGDYDFARTFGLLRGIS
jgi:hypothetical protein